MHFKKPRLTPASLYTHSAVLKEFGGKMFKIRAGRSDAVQDENGDWRFPTGKTRTKPKVEVAA